MRTGRVLSVLALAMTAAPLEAQATRLFRDSWFWGAKGGVVTFTLEEPAAVRRRVTAPTFGGEWLITRTQGALYASFDVAPFEGRSFVPDASVTTGQRSVRVKDLRRFTLGLMAFPKQFGSLRPYLGAGVGINLVGSASAEGTFSDPAARTLVNARIDERKSGAAPVLIAGLHMDVRPISLFAQGSVMTLNEEFLLNGAPPVGFEVGVRYNLAPAKERPRGR